MARSSVCPRVRADIDDARVGQRLMHLKKSPALLTGLNTPLLGAGRLMERPAFTVSRPIEGRQPSVGTVEDSKRDPAWCNKEFLFRTDEPVKLVVLMLPSANEERGRESR